MRRQGWIGLWLVSGVLGLLGGAGLLRPAAGHGSPPAATAPVRVNPASCAWERVANPDVGSARLSSVAIAGAASVWAVGPTHQGRGLIEQWDGLRWQAMAAPSPGTLYELVGIAASGPTDVWVVGSYDDSSSNLAQTLVLHWDGSAWSIIPSPNAGGDNVLQGVTAIGPDNVWAVGSSAAAQGGVPLILHWDGTTWQIVPTPILGGNLYSVAARGPSDIWAVGRSGLFTPDQPFALHWDGTGWSTVPIPNPGGQGFLRGVAVAGTTEAWAVGRSGAAALIEHWDGMTWQVITSPQPGTDHNTLWAVTASAANAVWAVGDYGNRNGPSPSLIEYWDGAQWSLSTGPNPGQAVNILDGVAAAAPDEIWAVGEYADSSVFFPLVAHYHCPASPTGTPTEVASPTATRTAPPSFTRTALPTPTPRGTGTCTSATPTHVPRPSVTPAPGCATTPQQGDLRAVITDHLHTTEATYTNRSTTCSYPIGLATYKKFDPNLDHQELYDYQLAVIPPNSTVQLTVNNPPCRYQADAFWGELIGSFAGGQRYGERRLDDSDGVQRARCPATCAAPGPTAPPRPASPTATPQQHTASGAWVEAAQQVQREWFAERPVLNNSELRPAEIQEFCGLDSAGQALSKAAMRQLNLSARVCHRVLKLARTIADLADSSAIAATHVAEALQYRAGSWT